MAGIWESGMATEVRTDTGAAFDGYATERRQRGACAKDTSDAVSKERAKGAGGLLREGIGWRGAGMREGGAWKDPS